MGWKIVIWKTLIRFPAYVWRGNPPELWRGRMYQLPFCQKSRRADAYKDIHPI